MSELVGLDQLDRALAAAGTDVRQIRALEELAEAGKRYAQTHEQRVAASIAKLKIARHGGRVLIEMTKRGERAKAGQRKGSTPEPLQRLDDLGLTKQRSSRWQAVARLTDAQYERREQAILEADPDAEIDTSVSMGGLKSSTGNEWYTPARYVEAARQVMGGIDLDPATSPLANGVVGATHIFTVADDGLKQDWFGRVWLNPPYGAGSGQFTTKLVEEYEADRVDAAVLLLNAYGFDSDWFQPLWQHPVCFTDHRITFTSPVRESGGPANGNIFVYFGTDERRFAEVFGEFGQVVRAWP